jgi:hypothetical protein
MKSLKRILTRFGLLRPAMAGNVPFLMKDVVLLATSVYPLKQDVLRASRSAKHG